MRFLLPIASVVLLAAIAPNPVQQSFAGRWNLTGTGEHADRVYWLEVNEGGERISGMFLYRTGSPLPIREARIEDGHLVFEIRDSRGEHWPGHRLRRDGDRLLGTINDRGIAVKVIGVPPPTWPEANASAAHTYGEPVALFAGGSLDAFTVQDKARPSGWSIEGGAMTNSPGANNLVSKQRFSNFRLQAEYKLEAGSNSGLYLRGRYELQVVDDHGKPPATTGHMAIYGWTAPLVNASKPPAEWQTADIVLVGNRVTAALNGQNVHDNAEIQAITGGALDANETSPGPIMVQGDHNRVWYRKLIVTPITSTDQ